MGSGSIARLLVVSSASCVLLPAPAPAHVDSVCAALAPVFGASGSAEWDERRVAARAAGLTAAAAGRGAMHELVYGELGISALANLLGALRIRPGDAFVDIGAGDGVLVLAAPLLYPELRTSRGIECLPELVARAEAHLSAWAGSQETPPLIDFTLADVYDPDGPASAILADSDVAVCFATTWAGIEAGTEAGAEGCTDLPRLAAILAATLRPGSRVALVDARLEPNVGTAAGGKTTGDVTSGFRLEAELRLECPDTVPYSTARIYTLVGSQTGSSVYQPA